jgi:hypothetical protein
MNLGLQFSICHLQNYKLQISRMIESKVPNPSYPTKWQANAKNNEKT